MKKTFKYISVSMFLLAFLAFCVVAAPSLAGTADSAAEAGVQPDASEMYLMAELPGEGTEEAPFLITDAEDLVYVAENINNGINASAYYRLTNNIDLGGREWTPIGVSSATPFSGHFDGNGYTVSDLKITEGEYVGFFGYVLNGTVTKLGIRNVKIDLSSDDAYTYVGILAGYVMASKGNSDISQVSITECEINVDTDTAYLYVGGIAGYGKAERVGELNITDSHASVNAVADNTEEYNYLGGLVGRLDTNSGSPSTIKNCYAIGSLRSVSYHSSYAGGLVGHLYSYGSSYSPEVGIAELADDDVDYMIIGSFAAVNVYSLSTEYTSYAGYIVGNCNTYADVKTVYYPITEDVTVTADAVSTTNKKVSDSNGNGMAPETFTNSELLSQTAGFDFENVWGVSDAVNNGYPYLLCVLNNKGVTIDLGEKVSSTNIRCYETDGNQYKIENDDNTLTVYPVKDMFVEVVEKDSDESIYTVCAKYYFVDYETLSYTEVTGLGTYIDNDGKTTIRTNAPLSIRFRAKISTLAKKEETDFAIEEYGYIVGVKSKLDEAGAQLNFDFSNYVTGVGYVKGTDIDIIFDMNDDEWCIFTGILKNIPEKNYTTVVTSKTYTKISVNGKTFTVYGEPVNASMYDIAKSLVDSEGVSDEQRAELEKIIEVVEKPEL